MLPAVPIIEVDLAEAHVQAPRSCRQATQANEVSALDAEDIQCIVGHGAVPFSQAQQPGLANYADGVDTLGFLLGEN
jgi:hypothetical protein